jgi:Flp pilus assembly protein TadG
MFKLVLRNRLSAFRQDKSGVSAIEFALILPVMVAMFFGIGEVTSYMQAHSRMTKVASTVADLVAQDTVISDDEMTNIFNCAEAIMQPFDSNNGWVRVSSIVANAAGQTTVAWSDGQGISDRAVGSAITVPGGVVPPNQSIIFTEVSYNYSSSFGMFLTSGVTATDQFYSRPRRAVAVARVP